MLLKIVFSEMVGSIGANGTVYEVKLWNDDYSAATRMALWYFQFNPFWPCDSPHHPTNPTQWRSKLTHFQPWRGALSSPSQKERYGKATAELFKSWPSRAARATPSRLAALTPTTPTPSRCSLPLPTCHPLVATTARNPRRDRTRAGQHRAVWNPAGCPGRIGVSTESRENCKLFVFWFVYYK